MLLWSKPMLCCALYTCCQLNSKTLQSRWRSCDRAQPTRRTCSVSSRVGVMTSAWQPSPRLTRGVCAASVSTIGARYASVLPVPVGARMSRSLPASRCGSAACCTAVGVA